MPITLQVTKKLSLTPLFDIQVAAFANSYSNGLWWLLYGGYKGVKPIPERYLVDNLKRDAGKGFFNGQHNDLLSHLGFYFGMVHGDLLSPRTGQLHPNVTTLVTFSHPDAERGYSVARRDSFYYAQPEWRLDTDVALLEELRAIAQDLHDYPDDGTSWYYSIGCILGNLNAPLFPATEQEWREWEAEYRHWHEQYEQDMAKAQGIRPLPTSVIEFAS